MLIGKNGGNRSQVSLRDFFRKYPTLFLLAAVSVAANACYTTIIPLVPFYFRERFNDPASTGLLFEVLKGFKHSEVLIGFLKGLGHSDMLIGLAYSVYVFSEMCFKPVAGTLGDRFRRTRLVMLGLFTGICTPFLLARAASPDTFMLVRLVDGVGAALVWPAMIGLFADTTDEEDRATAMSVFTMCLMAGMGTGVTLSPFLRALLGSYVYVFGAMSALMATGFIVMVFSSRTISAAAKKQRKKDDPYGSGTFRENIRKVSSNRLISGQLGTLVVLAFLQMFGTSMLTPTTFLFAADVLKWSEKEVWRTFLAAGAVIALIALPAGRFADRLGKENSVKIGMALASACLLTMAIVKQPWTLALAVVGYGISFAIGAPSWMALVTRGEWAGMRGAVLGIVTAFQGAGVVIGPTVGTLVWNDYGHYAPFATCAGILAICAIISFVGLRPIRPENASG